MKELTSKHVSILQIANDNTGVISLNEKDFLWIEQLSQASLITNEEQYFITSDSRLTFDFAYIQSQIIRIYLLYCRINYRHIIQKYQCHTKGIKSITNIEHLDLDENYLVRLNVDQIENEWNHLKDMLLDKLYQSHNLLRQIALTLKKYSNKLSSINLFEFVRMTDHDNDILPRLEQYEIKDFQLCYIDHVIEIYAKSVSGFQHLFTDVSALLRVSIDSQLNNEIIQKFNENIINIDYKNDIDEIQEKIQTITEFLNELKTIEDTLLQQSTQSLIEICQYLSIDSTLLSLIPYRIKCENYVDLYIHLIRTRSKLQEQKLNIEEQERNLWNEDFNSESDKQTLKQRQNNNDSHNWEISMTNIKKSTVDLTLENNLFDINQPSMKLSKDDSDTDIEYTSLITLNLKKVPYTSSIFIQQIHKYREELPTPSITVKSIQKITIVCPNGELKTYIWKPEKFCEKLNKLFEKQYDHNLFVVVDKNEIFVDFTKNNYCLPYEPLLKYYIIEKQLLIQIQIQFRAQIYEYFTTSKCTISTIIQHFIDDNQLKKLSSDIILCFYDEYGKCINDGTISDVFKKDQKIILIFVTEETLNTSFLYEFVLQSNTGNQKNTVRAMLAELTCETRL
ncbi:unnamed protein product [Rotaria sp. Silwood2]|nr:unnamed protein product [Rotaria sp. Silwood2]CAF4409472.1 unnamed protein product [Rotaria sp. Silwood2]